jgi:regulator of replication initiation timing
MTDQTILESQLAAAQFTVRVLRQQLGRLGKRNASLKAANTVLQERVEGWKARAEAAEAVRPYHEYISLPKRSWWPWGK